MRSTRRTGVVAGLAAVLAAPAAVSRAQTPAAPQSFTVGPGGRASVGFDAFCLDFGKPFPAQVQGPATVAPDRVRGALAEIQGRGLAADGQQALEAQYAVWQAQGAAGVPQGTDTTRTVLAAANTPPPTPSGTSLLEAARANQVQVTLDDWQAAGQPVAVGGGRSDSFYGRGHLTVQNTSNQTLTLFLPVGAVFAPADPANQNMAGYATSVQVQNTAQFLVQSGGGGHRAAPATLIGAVGFAAAGWLARRGHAARS